MKSQRSLPNIQNNPASSGLVTNIPTIQETFVLINIRGLLEKYPTFGREKETGLLGALGT